VAGRPRPSLDHDFTAPKRRHPRLGLFRSHWEPSGESGALLSYLEDLKRDGEMSFSPLIPWATRNSNAASAPWPTGGALARLDRRGGAALREDDLDLLLIAMM